eukprot:CAMPEP_0201571654 /NCGR_PEP_ID=MMETSP0190_2-20130828/14521_1 /ASSEMBLY_ACC=CAM_ASM_000263 /TAXON_ID=37353 /ORGANISM="Rosalina sp." /LENGTH=355 /DNA_ID=CAMNT_0047996529 /DNA_START=1240 /DNA_END=2307 /DNA_ORIENTATION=-
MKHLKGDIQFKNVSFSYPSAPKTIVLDNVSFGIEGGKTLAIVGPSGSGKSTVIGLLERFYDPSLNLEKGDEEKQEYGGDDKINGEIRIDGELIHNYDLYYLRKQIGYVSQLPLLFAESIRNNIRGGDSSITDEDIENAAKFADAHEFISKLPKGYDTNCGEMGNRLSGGQKQRIAIARAIVNKPSILLLDEATSALDTKSEREVQRAIDNISKSKSQTIVVIAHRLSTIKNADKILVMVDGEIEEQGDHQSLIDNDGVYAALVRSQQLVTSNNNDDDSNDSKEDLDGGYDNMMDEVNNDNNNVEEEAAVASGDGDGNNDTYNEEDQPQPPKEEDDPVVVDVPPGDDGDAPPQYEE